MEFQDFNILNIGENQVAESFLTTGFGEAHRLPAYKRDLSGRSLADSVWMNSAGKRFARHRYPAHTSLVRCAPELLRDLLHSINADEVCPAAVQGPKRL